jgi:hypothetical protein
MGVEPVHVWTLSRLQVRLTTDLTRLHAARGFHTSDVSKRSPMGTACNNKPLPTCSDQNSKMDAIGLISRQTLA